MEEQERSDLLSNLYTLRAGMSAVAMKMNQIEEEQERIERVNDNNVKELNNIYSYSVYRDRENLIRGFSTIDHYNNNKIYEEVQEKLQRVESEKLTGKNLVMYSICLVFSIIMFVVGVCLFTLSLISGIDEMDSSIAFVFLPMAIGGIVLVSAFGYKMKNFKKNVEDDNRHINELKKFNRLFKEYEEKYDSLQQTYNKLKNKNISDGSKIIVGLKSQFNSLVDYRDWQYLDIIIYNIETRRADSMKEALILMDREVQTQRIEKAICTATMFISKTLVDGFTMINYTLESNFAMLNESIGKLKQSVDYNSALVSFANVSSAKLIAQISKLDKKLK